MSRDFQLDIAVKEIESAFNPLECAVTVFDGRQRLWFRVHDRNDKPLLTVHEALARRVQDRNGLKAIVTACRSIIESKGHKLKPWKIPPKNR